MHSEYQTDEFHSAVENDEELLEQIKADEQA